MKRDTGVGVSASASNGKRLYDRAEMHMRRADAAG